MKNFKKKDLPTRCLIDPDCLDCDSIRKCRHESCDDDCCSDEPCTNTSFTNSDNSILISSLPAQRSVCNHERVIAKGRGTITEQDGTHLEFNFTITDNNGFICGDVAIADYQNTVLLSSDNLQSYNQCTPCSFCAVFCDCNSSNSTQTRYISLFCQKRICGNPAQLFVYSPPFCGVNEVSAGGNVDEGGCIRIADSECCC